MTIWIDPPLWPAHGRMWSHLVSDTSYEELHDFAERAGIPARGFEGDHYDVPDVRHADLVALGAVPTDAHDLVRRLIASGLRQPKRRSVKPLVRIKAIPVLDALADVDLVVTERPAPVDQVFAAMAFVESERGHWAVVRSVTRAQWGAPGGWREAGESPLECAVREVREETGLVIDPSRLAPCGYERFVWRSRPPRGGVPGSLLQCYRTRIDGEPVIASGTEDVDEVDWVDRDEFRHRCESAFYWPLVAQVILSPGVPM